MLDDTPIANGIVRVFTRDEPVPRAHARRSRLIVGVPLRHSRAPGARIHVRDSPNGYLASTIVMNDVVVIEVQGIAHARLGKRIAGPAAFPLASSRRSPILESRGRRARAHATARPEEGAFGRTEEPEPVARPIRRMSRAPQSGMIPRITFLTPEHGSHTRLRSNPEPAITTAAA